ncbi:hypothetical protein TNCV_2545431 [Trichonephila clavipes]|nr:hypothetical protein TNCV_2545431 [Trichonephila clavipes]
MSRRPGELRLNGRNAAGCPDISIITANLDASYRCDERSQRSISILQWLSLLESFVEKKEKKVSKIGEIGIVIKEVVDLAKQINLKVDVDDVQEVVDSLNLVLTIDELIEMHEQEQDI